MKALRAWASQTPNGEKQKVLTKDKSPNDIPRYHKGAKQTLLQKHPSPPVRKDIQWIALGTTSPVHATPSWAEQTHPN